MLEKDILFQGGEKVKGIGVLTIFDLDSIPDDLSYDDTVYYIREYLGTGYLSLDLINNLFQDAVAYLKNELFYEDCEFGSLNNKTFLTLDDVVEFIAGAKKIKGRINCTIIKQILAIYECSSKYNHRISEIVEKTKRVVEGKLIGGFTILDESEDGSELSGVFDSESREIPFTLKKRAKSDSSRIAKTIKDPEYRIHEFLSDEYGVTFEVDNKEDIPVLMEYVASITFKRGVYEIKNKGMLSDDDINNGNISEDFRQRLLSAKKSKKDQSADDYSDIKMVTPYYKGDETKNLSLEIKFVVSDNSNEKGLSMQGIYGYMKKIDQRIRLEGFVSRKYIEKIVDMFLLRLESILCDNIGREDKDVSKFKKELFNDLKKKGFIDSSFNLRQGFVQESLDQFLRTGLVGYYRDLLRPVKVGKSQDRNKYYTNSRGVEIGKLELWSTNLQAQD